MRLIANKHGKSDKYDLLQCIRSDGSETTSKMPRQGILPHDLVHFVVETSLKYDHGFLGLVAKGADMAFVMEQTHDIKNLNLADQATHAEAIVESLQAQIWSGTFDNEQFIAGVEGACLIRSCTPPNLSDINPKTELYQAALELNDVWM
jgi:hypothetical protein